MVIDGVVDPVRWQSGTEQAVLSMIFRDTDKALESFVEECLKVNRPYRHISSNTRLRAY